uniref:Nuclear receptor n=1 Tax=Brachionus koreanus TaxID=1199090 RepID=A0A221CB85_9BILA|nr:nuclear receptor [Brachionus koreanus]
MVEKNLSDKQILDALSFEYYLNKKRTQKDKFEVKYNFGKCRICKSEATGIHYGVSSCEGCKGFFKRSLTRHKNYVCKSGQDCSIFPKQRKKCKYCRWVACVNAGMSLSEVRVGRIPNHMKEIKPKRETHLGANTFVHKNKFCLSLKHFAKYQKFDRDILPESRLVLPNTIFTEKYLNSSNESQLIVFSLLRDKSYQIFKEHSKEFDEHEKLARKLIESSDKPKILEKTADMVFGLKKKNMNALLKHAGSMFKIIEELPGFQRISKRDLPRILSDGFFMVFGVRAIKLYFNDDYFFMLDENTPMNREIFALLTSETVRDSAFDFFSKFKKLNLTDQEYALLIPIFLTMFTLNSKLERPEIVKELSEYYSRALLYQFSLNNRNNEFLENFRRMISYAPRVNKICQELEYEREING